MQLHTLIPTKVKKSKRLGRGYGSGKGGHTVGRGQKGQKSRGKIPAHFIGSSWVWFKRLPFLRGKSRFNSLSNNLTLTVGMLDQFKNGSTIDLAALTAVGLISKTQASRAKVKLVEGGQLTKKLTVLIPASQKAQASIKQAGGTVGAASR